MKDSYSLPEISSRKMSITRRFHFRALDCPQYSAHKYFFHIVYRNRVLVCTVLVKYIEKSAENRQDYDNY